MIQHWKDVLLAAGYRKGVNDHYISPSGTHYSPEEIARLFGEAINMNQNPLTNAYLQAQNYNAQNNVPQAQVTSVAPSQYNQGLHPYHNPQHHHGLGAAGTQSVPSSIYPLPTGEIAETAIYDPVLDYVGTIHVDRAFIPMLDYINVVSRQRQAQHQAQRQAKLNEPDDFSLDEVKWAEDMIAELNID